LLPVLLASVSHQLGLIHQQVKFIKVVCTDGDGFIPYQERLFTTEREITMGMKGGAGRYYYNSYYFYMVGPIPALEESGIRTNTIAKLSLDIIWPRGMELGLGCCLAGSLACSSLFCHMR